MLTPSIQSNHTHATEYADAMEGSSEKVTADKKPPRSLPTAPEGPLANLLREPHLVQAIASHLDPRSVRNFANLSKGRTLPYLQLEFGAATIESRAPHLRRAELNQAQADVQNLPTKFQEGPINAIAHRERALAIESNAPHMTHPAQITNAYLDVRALPAEFQEGPVNAVRHQASELERRELEAQMESLNTQFRANLHDAAQEQ